MTLARLVNNAALKWKEGGDILDNEKLGRNKQNGTRSVEFQYWRRIQATRPWRLRIASSIVYGEMQKPAISL